MDCLSPYPNEVCLIRQRRKKRIKSAFWPLWLLTWLMVIKGNSSCLYACYFLLDPDIGHRYRSKVNVTRLKNVIHTILQVMCSWPRVKWVNDHLGQGQSPLGSRSGQGLWYWQVGSLQHPDAFFIISHYFISQDIVDQTIYFGWLNSNK